MVNQAIAYFLIKTSKVSRMKHTSYKQSLCLKYVNIEKKVNKGVNHRKFMRNFKIKKPPVLVVRSLKYVA